MGAVAFTNITQMEHHIYSAMAAVENSCKKIWPVEVINGRTCFVKTDGSVFTITSMYSEKNLWAALVVEYADNRERMSVNCAEDGDQFVLENYDEMEDLVRDVMNEIIS